MRWKRERELRTRMQYCPPEEHGMDWIRRRGMDRGELGLQRQEARFYIYACTYRGRIFLKIARYFCSSSPTYKTKQNSFVFFLFLIVYFLHSGWFRALSKIMINKTVFRLFFYFFNTAFCFTRAASLFISNFFSFFSLPVTASHAVNQYTQII